VSDLGSIFGPFIGIVVSVLAAVVIMVGGAWGAARFGGGPAQAAYVGALESRLKLLEAERTECKTQLAALVVKVDDLEHEIRALMAENLDLRRPPEQQRMGHRP
jgi:chromosome segregation ATPase